MKSLLAFVFFIYIGKVNCDLITIEFEENDNVTTCLYHYKEPAVEPNLYYCIASDCCILSGIPRCCTLKQNTWLNESLGPTFFFVIIAIICCHTYFISDIFQCIYYPKKSINQTRAMAAANIAKLAVEYEVTPEIEDPLFQQNKTRDLDYYIL